MNALTLFAIVGLPIAELWLLIELGGVFGALPILLYVIALIGLGVVVLRSQAFAVTGLLQSLRGQRMPTRRELGAHALYATAGLLFAFPGVITDVAALVLIVMGLARRKKPKRAKIYRGNDVEVLPPGEVASPFTKRPKVIDVTPER